MQASSTLARPSSLPSLSSSGVARSHSVPTHVAFTAPSNARTVVTAPPWAQDEPPSPTDQSDELHRFGHRNNTHARPLDLASSSGSSSEGLPDKSGTRSRWWTFARPRDRSEKHDPWGVDATTSTMGNQPMVGGDPRSQYTVKPHERPSEESPILRSPVSSLPPSGPSGSKAPGRASPLRGRSKSRDGDCYQYTQMGERQDVESADKSTVSRSRRNRFRAFILSNIYVPLLFRFINITFTTSALAVAIHIRLWEASLKVMGILGSSPTLVIIFAPLTLVHVMVAIYLEYFGRPLGLWRTSAKLAHTLLEVCFICAWSAALSLCFDNYFTSSIPCASSDSIAWYSQLPRPPLTSSGDLGQAGGIICNSQLALICLVMVGLIMYCTNLVISLFRIFEKVKYHAGTRRRV